MTQKMTYKRNSRQVGRNALKTGRTGARTRNFGKLHLKIRGEAMTEENKKVLGDMNQSELLEYIETLQIEIEFLRKKVNKYILRWGIIQ